MSDLDLVELSALGSRFSLRVAAADAGAFAHAWSRCPVEGVEGAAETESIDAQSPYELSARSVLSRVTGRAIARAAGRLLMFHAAAVAGPDGRVVGLVGPSGSGKTTAAIALGQLGFGYVTDEALAVTDDGAVEAFPRPLAVRDDEDGIKRVIPPAELELAETSGRLSLGRMVILDRHEEGCNPSFVPLPRIDAFLELIPQASALPKTDLPLQRMARMVDACAGVYRFNFSQIGDVEARAIQSFLDAELEAKDLWQPLERPADDDIARNLGLRDTRIRRGGVLDGIRVDDEALLMVGATPIRLSGLGLTIWEAAAGAPTFDELVERVVAEHGPHPDAESLVREAVDSMVEAKVLGFGTPVTVEQFLASMAPQLSAASDDACCGGA